VRERDDGAFEFLGRFDDQVKIRGHRIEPGEVEAALRQAPGVREAAVIAREDVPGEKRLVAYVVGDGAGATPAALRAFLAERLPAFLIPAAIVAMDALPLNKNGKVDKKALPAPAAGERAIDDDAVPPRNATEARIAALWSELLRTPVASLGVHDDFFARGGHSLLGMELIRRVGDAFGVEVPLQCLFERPTIAALGERVQELAPSTDGEEVTL
jgi:hypothetical protein